MLAFQSREQAPAGKSLENSEVSADLDTGVARGIWVGFTRNGELKQECLRPLSKQPPGLGEPGAAHSGDGAQPADGAPE